MFSNTAQYDFEWGKTKDETNLIKHGISFASATEIFLDPLAISQFDISHSIYEERWWTIGTISIGKLVVISHTFIELASNRSLIRQISARFATKKNGCTMKSCKQTVIAMSTKLFYQAEDEMPDEIDFSRGEQGRFYKPNAKLNLPIYIDGVLHARLSAIANEQGLDVSAYANALLMNDLETLDSKK